MEATVELDAIRQGVQAALRRAVGEDPLPLYQMVRYHLGLIDEHERSDNGAGKMLRPLFCCLACAAVRGDWRPACQAAAAIELTHNFSLVHDDIEDGDRERRHRPTVWARWGLAQGINAGDAVWVLAWQTLTRAIDDGVPAATVMRCVERLADACREMIEGQYLDLALEGTGATDQAQYLRIINAKTAALLACSFELGARCGGAGEPTVRAYAETGRLLGLSFQMQDDILGVWGDPALTGKPTGNDIRRKKMSLPVLCALDHLPAAQGEQLRRLYRTAEPLDDGDIGRVLELFEQSEARAFAERMADRYAAEAEAALARLPHEHAAAQTLTSLAASLVQRTS